MAARRAPITQADLTRIGKAMRDAGVAQWQAILRPNGELVISAGTALPGDDGTPNPCDRLLPR